MTRLDFTTWAGRYSRRTRKVGDFDADIHLFCVEWYLVRGARKVRTFDEVTAWLKERGLPQSIDAAMRAWNTWAIETRRPGLRTVADRLDIDPTRAGTSKEGE